MSSTPTGRDRESRPFFRTKRVQVEASSGPFFVHPSLLLTCLRDAFASVSWELVTVSSLFVCGLLRDRDHLQLFWALGPDRARVLIPVLLFAGRTMIAGMLHNFSEPLFPHV